MHKGAKEVKICAALFDLDGTLLDSMGMWAGVDERFLQKRGIAVPKDYQDAVSVMRMHEASRYTISRFSLRESPEAIEKEWLDMARDEYAYHIELKPYAAEYLHMLHAHGIKLGVVTSNVGELYEPLLRRCGIDGLFTACTSAHEVARGKAFPDAYLLAADRLSAKPDTCIMYDDMPQALIGAKAAGMYTVGVLDSTDVQHRRELMRAADRCIESFDEELHAQPPLYAQ